RDDADRDLTRADGARRLAAAALEPRGLTGVPGINRLIFARAARSICAAMIESERARPTRQHSGDFAMRPTSALALLALCAWFAAGPLAAEGFSFSRDAAQQQAQEQADEAAKQQRIGELLSTPCRNDLKGKKIAVVIGEVQSNGWIVAHQENWGPHFRA